MAPLDIEPSQDLESGSAKPVKKVFSESSFHHGKFDLKVVNLNYKVSKKAKDGSVETKTLLTNVNARAKPGEILAIVGPSGAGKSTFLDAIAGRIDPASLDGELLINGKPVEASFKRSSGYVMQDDALFPMLTVKETLLFSARLRLPACMDTEEKKERVEMLISELGLKKCADTRIGNAEVRGVSGGEKRRVSIGVDLIHDPPVLFLDEPTSGLDSTSALNVIQNLHDIAEQRERTILLTIHQPSFRILELIHNFLILARGNVIYHGPYPEMIQYFRDFGRVIPDHVNALEYSLDLIEEQQNSEEGLTPLIEFRDSRSESKVDRNLSSLSSIGQLSEAEYANNFVSETLVLADRNAKNIFRTKELFNARIGLMVMTSLTMGSLFFNTKYSEKGVTQRQSFFAFELALLLFTSTEALPIFLEERQIYIRETSRGAYRTASYVIANAMVFLPFLFALALIFSAISYFMVGLYSDFDAFFIFVATNFLVLAVANSFVIFFGALVPNFITGNTIITATTAYFFLFSGFFIPKSGIPDYWIWMHYLSTFKYPLEVMQKNEYSRINIDCWKYKNSVCLTSKNIMSNFDVEDVSIVRNSLIMVLFFIAYRVFFYVALRFQTASVRK